ncbi:MAG: heme exporter protein CcmB [Deltaproteobacteria bacterium]|nr:heme exporter protein CcmB [Deltaproteobacteria bacterium]MBW2154151.1 heme exporter protein CcmB [Deltaproteobacteria bacterium]
MSFALKLQAIVWKDLKCEFRTRETILSMSLLSFLVLIIFHFALGSNAVNLKNMTPGVVWIAFVFSGLIGLGRAFNLERDRGTLAGLLLCPLSPWGIYAAKTIGVFVFTTIMEVFTLLLAAVLYNLNLWHNISSLALVIFLGTAGFSIIGTLLSAISANAKATDILLSILVLPLSVPLMIASVKATGLILQGNPIQTAYSWLKLLIAFDLAFLLVSYLTFEYVLEELS